MLGYPYFYGNDNLNPSLKLVKVRQNLSKLSADVYLLSTMSLHLKNSCRTVTHIFTMLLHFGYILIIKRIFTLTLYGFLDING